jgi:dolichol-phosphate mannosyltransferase
MDRKPRLSIVCPAFEEAEGLPLFHDALRRVVAGLEASYEIEILYVDDGSRDATLHVLDRLARDDRRVGYISLSRNFGKEAALTAGLEHARGDLVLTLDADLQHPPELIPDLLAKWQEGNDVVVGVRLDTEGVRGWKRVAANWFYRLLARMSNARLAQSSTDYCLLTRPAVQSLLRLGEVHRFQRGLVQWIGFVRCEVPFIAPRRVAGSTKFSLRSLFALGLDALTSFSRMPLRLAATAGLVLLFVAVLQGLDLVGSGLLPSIPWPPVSFLLFSLYLIGGLILGALGVVGEYVGRIYEQVKQRPLYFVKARGGVVADAPQDEDADKREHRSAA